MTQGEVALKIGVSQSRVARIENDPSAISFIQLFEVLNALGIEVILRDKRPSGGAVGGIWPGKR